MLCILRLTQGIVAITLGLWETQPSVWISWNSQHREISTFGSFIRWKWVITSVPAILLIIVCLFVCLCRSDLPFGGWNHWWLVESALGWWAVTNHTVAKQIRVIPCRMMVAVVDTAVCLSLEERRVHRSGNESTVAIVDMSARGDVCSSVLIIFRTSSIPVTDVCWPCWDWNRLAHLRNNNKNVLLWSNSQGIVVMQKSFL